MSEKKYLVQEFFAQRLLGAGWKGLRISSDGNCEMSTWWTACFFSGDHRCKYSYITQWKRERERERENTPTTTIQQEENEMRPGWKCP